MKTEIDNGNVQKNNAPRYVVSIGSFVNEGAALARRDAAAKAGYRSEIIDLRDDNTTTTIAALLLIAEQVKLLNEKIDSVTQSIKDLTPKSEQKTEQKPEPKPEPKKQQTEGELIREYRKRNGLTVRGLSEKTGLGKSTVSNYESRITKPSAKALFILQDALNIPTEEIIKCL